LSDVEAFVKAFLSLIVFVKLKYPEIDLAMTNLAASVDYAKYYAE
jgi:hypothetical protein